MDEPEVARRVEAILADFVIRQAESAAARGLPNQAPLVLGDFLAAGGKRIRPLLCVLGWHAAGARGNADAALQVAASLEMFHAFALIHDDIMDRSATRRGRPTVHRALAADHAHGRSAAAADHLGEAGAILVGDFALAWADELLHTARLSPGQLWRVLPLMDDMRGEVLYGQYLDITVTGTRSHEHAVLLRIIRYKTAKYTCERPLHIGAALAGTDEQLLCALSDFALPLGEAFQLRDDLLGVFGNVQETGKPALDDLREGKQTVLVALALAQAPRAQAGQLRQFLGCPTLTEEQAAGAWRIITASAAPRRIEDMIRERYDQALSALGTAPIPIEVRERLRALADGAVWRTT
ncbi:polyprenyl synthetase family protein [Streptomyces sp. NPDC006285]|uniref:polyprenyl synthetase family protein n=1 Tax=Streptomyces sp. NPDC006285 TaxID=3364742 RepID=UPI00367B0746